MIPEKIKIAFLNTPIYKLERISEVLGKNIYIKRDDLTGIEFSGNKVRKLEYSVKEALNQGATTLITCGGIQSNHARETVAVSKRLGLNAHIVLTSNGKPALQGNYLLDNLLGAKITLIPEEDADNFNKVMEEIKEEYKQKGEKAYIIPMGASNGIGNFGYAEAYSEILRQEKEMDVEFDTIACAVGSGGTQSGLLLGAYLQNNYKKIVGINVTRDAEYFKNAIIGEIKESFEYLDKEYKKQNFNYDIRDGYVGPGYAKTNEEQRDFIAEIAKLEGLLLDPVYTGKAFRGLCEEIKKDRFKDSKNILFIHTGGLYGLFPSAELFHKE